MFLKVFIKLNKISSINFRIYSYDFVSLYQLNEKFEVTYVKYLKRKIY